MRKRVKWSRPKKTLRNWLLVLILAVILCGLDSFPPLTKQALVKDILRDNLMCAGDIVWEEKDWQGNEKIYIRSGDTVVRTTYQWDLLRLAYNRWNDDILYGYDGVTCIPSSGTPGEMLAFGDFPEEASVVLELRMSTGLLSEKDRIYVVEGVRKSDNVISFTLSETHENDAEFFSDWLQRTAYPEGYYNYTLRLYDAAGQEIGTWTNMEEQETT